MPIKAQSILLIPNQSGDFGVLQSTIALAQTLRNAKISFSILTDETPPEEYTQFTLYDINSSKEFSLNLTSVEDKVTSINWRQAEEIVEIRLTTENGNPGNPEVEITTNNSSFDMKIFIGLDREEAQLVDIAEDGGLDKQNSVFLEELEEGEVIPVLVFNYLKKNKLKIDEHSALNLLEGLYKSTKNFTRKQSAEGFFVASKLMTIIKKYLPKDMDSSVTDGATIEKRQMETDLKPASQDTIPATEKENQPNITSDAQTAKTEEVQTSKVSISEENSQEPIPMVSEPIIEIKEPEVLPADYDPLAPASEMPRPLVLEKEKAQQPKPVDNSPLPGAQ